jgi:hypothetical protein
MIYFSTSVYHFPYRFLCFVWVEQDEWAKISIIQVRFWFSAVPQLDLYTYLKTLRYMKKCDVTSPS